MTLVIHFWPLSFIQNLEPESTLSLDNINKKILSNRTTLKLSLLYLFLITIHSTWASWTTSRSQEVSNNLISTLKVLFCYFKKTEIVENKPWQGCQISNLSVIPWASKCRDENCLGLLEISLEQLRVRNL